VFFYCVQVHRHFGPPPRPVLVVFGMCAAPTYPVRGCMPPVRHSALRGVVWVCLSQQQLWLCSTGHTPWSAVNPTPHFAVTHMKVSVFALDLCMLTREVCAVSLAVPILLVTRAAGGAQPGVCAWDPPPATVAAAATSCLGVVCGHRGVPPQPLCCDFEASAVCSFEPWCAILAPVSCWAGCVDTWCAVVNQSTATALAQWTQSLGASVLPTTQQQGKGAVGQTANM
jgi:hypothetical protein